MTKSPLIKVFGSIAILGAAASIAGLGTYATFTSSTSASQSVSSGSVSIALGTAGTAQNRLTVAASGVVPGDTIQRAVDLTKSSTDPLGGVTLTTTASPSSLLDTDATNGLQMKIEECSTAWTEGGTAPAYTYTCGGTTTTILNTTPVIQTNASLSGLNALNSGAQTDHLRVTLSLPAGAGNTLQSQSSTISYAFTATQRAATSK